jgi:hypothetical protein
VNELWQIASGVAASAHQAWRRAINRFHRARRILSDNSIQEIVEALELWKHY